MGDVLRLAAEGKAAECLAPALFVLFIVLLAVAFGRWQRRG